MAKIHLVQSQEPLKSEGRDQTAMCGRTVIAAQIVAMVDVPIVGFGSFELMSQISSFGMCAKCRAEKWNLRYIYAVREGQDAPTV